LNTLNKNTKKLSFRALGIIFYEFNTGKLPFNGDEIELVRQIKNKPTPDLPSEFRQLTLFDDLLKRFS
jgi:serine/threonine protein kinase